MAKIPKPEAKVFVPEKRIISPEKMNARDIQRAVEGRNFWEGMGLPLVLSIALSIILS
jgi:hypothetical protein